MSAARRRGRARERSAKGQPALPLWKTVLRWCVELLIAAWVLAVVVIYFRLQLVRLLEIARPDGK